MASIKREEHATHPRRSPPIELERIHPSIAMGMLAIITTIMPPFSRIIASIIVLSRQSLPRCPPDQCSHCHQYPPSHEGDSNDDDDEGGGNAHLADAEARSLALQDTRGESHLQTPSRQHLFRPLHPGGGELSSPYSVATTHATTHQPRSLTPDVSKEQYLSRLEEIIQRLVELEVQDGKQPPPDRGLFSCVEARQVENTHFFFS